MKKTRWIALAAVASLGTSLVACSPDPSAGEGKESSDSVTVWVMGDSSANFDKLVAPFEEESGIDVETVAVPWDGIDQRFTTAVASGDGPDVLQIGLSKLRTYADSGALASLDADTVADYPNLAADNFIDGIAGDATAIDGEVVSLPWVSDTRLLFVRTDILAENGIDAPFATWDELRADAKILAGRGDGQYGFYIPQWNSPLPVMMTWAEGGDIVADDGTIDFDTPEFEKAVDLYSGFYEDGSVPTNSDFEEIQGFISGAVPLHVSGPYLGAAVASTAPELDGKWTAVTLPGGAANTSLLAGSNLSVWGDTDNREGALRLLDFLSEPETQLEWFSLAGELPTTKAALADDAITGDPLGAVYAEQLADSKILPLVPNWDGETGKALLDALNSIVLTGADRDAALQGLFDTTTGTPTN
jgi:multiple sugar transport system substrate-binding protein